MAEIRPVVEPVIPVAQPVPAIITTGMSNFSLIIALVALIFTLILRKVYSTKSSK